MPILIIQACFNKNQSMFNFFFCVFTNFYDQRKLLKQEDSLYAQEKKLSIFRLFIIYFCAPRIMRQVRVEKYLILDKIIISTFKIELNVITYCPKYYFFILFALKMFY